MEEHRSTRSANWMIRRAELIDVPAVARLLGAPTPAGWRRGATLSAQALTSATRLVLTHVALDLGEFWVAVEADNRVRAAVVLLPPGRQSGHIMDLTLRLELGLPPSTRPEPLTLEDAPEQYWLLLPAAEPGDEPILRELIAAALPAIDADGRAILSLQTGPAAQLLSEVGFRDLPAPAHPGSALLRPAARQPVGV